MFWFVIQFEKNIQTCCCTWTSVVFNSGFKYKRFAACKVLQDELHRKILDSLLDFTRKCSSTRQHSDWASQMRASEIPTAALVLGVLVTFDTSWSAVQIMTDLKVNYLQSCVQYTWHRVSYILYRCECPRSWHDLPESIWVAPAVCQSFCGLCTGQRVWG